MIRRAIAADAGAIADIWNRFIRDTLVTFNSVEKSVEEVAGMIETRDAAGHAAFVAEVGGDVAGFVTYAQFRGGVGYAHTMEHTILLSGAMRGQGLGRALMQAVEDHARGQGAHSLFAGVSAGNLDGRAFHAALGYAEIAVLPQVGRKFGHWLDLHLMQKML